MTTFLALYQGQTVASAEFVALTSDETLIVDFARRLVAPRTPEIRDVLPPDPHHRKHCKEKAPPDPRG